MPAPSVPDPRVDVLLTEVVAIRHRLDLIGRTLGVEPAAAAATVTTPARQEAVATPAASNVWAPPAGRDAGQIDENPAATSAPVAGATAPVAIPFGPERAPRAPRIALTPARVLAAGGALVTILGVGFLLAVAIAAGLFGPVPRVLTLTALAVGLGVVAGKQRTRSPEAATALAATSTAASFGVVVAATAVYEWVHPFVGVAAGLAITAGGVAVAHRWRSELLAALVQAQIFVVLPIILAPLDDAARTRLTIFAALAYLPGIWAVGRHRWVRLFRFASGGLLLVAGSGLFDAAMQVEPGLAGWLRLSVSWVVVLGVAVLACLFDEAAVAAAAVTGSAIASVTLRQRVVDAGAFRFDVLVVLVVAALLAVGAWRYRREMRAVLAVGAGVHLFLATVFLPVGDDTRVALMATEALLLLIAARARASRVTAAASVAFTAASVVGLMAMVRPWEILAAGFGSGDGRWAAVLTGLMLALIGGLHVRWAGVFPVRHISRDARVLAGAALGLYGISAAVVRVGTMTGSSTVTMAANVVTTIVWVAVAVALVLAGSPRITRAGYVLLAVSVGKLFLADLHSVDGILRAVLFVLTGLVLIAASSGIRRKTDRADETDGARVETKVPQPVD